MSGSSELSDALNPYYYLSRQSISGADVLTSPSGTVSPTLPLNVQDSEVPVLSDAHTIHQSENRDATNTAPNTSQTNLRQPSLAPRPNRRLPIEPVQFMRGLVATLSSYKEAAEVEKKRRIAWEKSLEEKYVQRQTDMERRLQEMHHEIDFWKQRTALLAGLNTQERRSQMTASPPGESEVSATLHPEFIEGSSASLEQTASTLDQGMTGKRSRSSVSLENDHNNMKSRTCHDRRHRTIHAAMRNHITTMMSLENDKVLPPSHKEGDALEDNSPVRFVWSQTTRRSAHNSRMKARIVSDMIANKELYPLIAAQDFVKASLESAFEQAFTTLRQKAMGHTENSAGAKARRSRRMSRKKIKLAKRIATRKFFAEYSSPKFDAAFQLDCMSSEESSEDDSVESEDGTRHSTVFWIRYLSWRSERLHNLYDILDEKEEADRSQKPKRGVGRKVRQVGEPKDGNPPPPQGIAKWMVSKKWIREAETSNPVTASIVQEIIRKDRAQEHEASPAVLASLGDESEDDAEPLPTLDHSIQHPPRHQSAAPLDAHAFIQPQWNDGYGTLYDSAPRIHQ